MSGKVERELEITLRIKAADAQAIPLLKNQDGLNHVKAALAPCSSEKGTAEVLKVREIR